MAEAKELAVQIGQRNAQIAEATAKRNAEAEAERQRQIDKTTAKLNYEKKTMGKLESKVKTANANMNKSFIAGGKAIKHLTTRIGGLIRRVLIFTVIAQSLNKFKNVVASVISSDNEFAQSLEQLKTALWTAFVPIYDIILPAVKTLVSWLTQVITILLRFYSLLSGKSLQALQARGKELQKTSKGYDKNTKAIKKNNKALKDNLASFDKINVLQKEDEGSGGGGGGAPTAKPNTSVLKDTVSGTLVEVTSILGGFLFVLGVILVVMGQIPIGLGLMLAGATLFTGATAVGINSSEMKESTKTALAEMVPILSAFLAVLGVVLLVAGNIPLGLGMIIAGIALFAGVTAITMKSDTTSQTIKSKLGNMVATIAPFLAVLGTLFLITGNIPVGLGMIIAGIAMFAFTFAVANDSTKTDMLTRLQGMAQVIAPFIAILGVVLLFTGHFGLGLGMLLAGFGLFGVGYANYNGSSITEFIRKILDRLLSMIRSFGKTVQFVLTHPVTAIAIAIRGLGNFVIRMLNALLRGATGLVNGVIKLLNKLPDVNIHQIRPVQLGYIDLPRVPALARGAVIAGGKPFMAMLGDQPSGQTNVEAPLSTIQEAMANVLEKQGNTQQQPIILELDGRELGRAVIDTSKRELNRIGVNMIVGEA